MEDLKIIARNQNSLVGMLTVFKAFGNDGEVDFNLDKCVKATF